MNSYTIKKKIEESPWLSQSFAVLPYKKIQDNDFQDILLFTYNMFFLGEGYFSKVQVGLILKTRQLYAIKLEHSLRFLQKKHKKLYPRRSYGGVFYYSRQSNWSTYREEYVALLRNGFATEKLALEKQGEKIVSGKYKGRFFLGATYSHNASLEEILSKQYLNLFERLELGIKLFLAAKKLIEKGIYHGDLSLQHIRLKSNGDVFFIDFNSATFNGSNNALWDCSNIFYPSACRSPYRRELYALKNILNVILDSQISLPEYGPYFEIDSVLDFLIKTYLQKKFKECIEHSPLFNVNDSLNPEDFSNQLNNIVAITHYERSSSNELTYQFMIARHGIEDATELDYCYCKPYFYFEKFYISCSPEGALAYYDKYDIFRNIPNKEAASNYLPYDIRNKLFIDHERILPDFLKKLKVENKISRFKSCF